MNSISKGDRFQNDYYVFEMKVMNSITLRFICTSTYNLIKQKNIYNIIFQRTDFRSYLG